MVRRTAVVTGAAGGFGRAVVGELLDHGWDVVAVVRPGGSPFADPAAVDATAPADPDDLTDPADPAGSADPDDRLGDLGSPLRGRPVVVPGDVRSDLSDLLAGALGARPLDLLVNDAATGTPARPSVLDIDADDLLRVVDVNAVGALRTVQACLPALLAATDPLVLNVSSRLGSVSAQAGGAFRELRTSYAYRVSKAALNMLTTCLAQELSGRVRVWSVHPGVLATGMGRSGATTTPEQAAARLRVLASSADRTSPRFVTLDSPDGPDLAW